MQSLAVNAGARIPHSVVNPFDVLLLMHMDGTDGSSTFIDNSANAFVLTALGATITTAQFVFGGASGSFDGINDRVLTPANALFDPNTTDFTIESRVRLTDSSVATRPILSQQEGGTTNGWMFFIDAATKRVAFASGPGASQIFVATSGGLTVNAWDAVAVTKKGSTLRLYQGGALVGQFTYVPGTVSLSGQNVMVGFGLGVSASIWGIGDTRWWQGQLDELRYVRDTALYIRATYVLATTEFPNST